jgi:nitrate/TMAO reductase-like tetraheme cytochrome c subunit
LFSTTCSHKTIKGREETTEEEIGDPAKVEKPEKEKNNAKLLFEKKCSICHPIRRPKSKRQTREQWEATVMKMRNTYNAPISLEQARTIIDYLAENYGTK